MGETVELPMEAPIVQEITDRNLKERVRPPLTEENSPPRLFQKLHVVKSE